MKRSERRANMPVERQWPNRLTSGKICYSRADSYEGFSLQDAEHGIPTFGSVTEEGVKVFNYPDQTEDIARRLVACWNLCVGIKTDALENNAGLVNLELKELYTEGQKQ